MGVEGSKFISNDDTSRWEDVEEEDKALAHLEDKENSYPMEGVKERAYITVSNYPAFLKILLTVARIFNPLHSNAFNLDGNWLHNAVYRSCKL